MTRVTFYQQAKLFSQIDVDKENHSLLLENRSSSGGRKGPKQKQINDQREKTINSKDNNSDGNDFSIVFREKVENSFGSAGEEVVERSAEAANLGDEIGSEEKDGMNGENEEKLPKIRSNENEEGTDNVEEKVKPIEEDFYFQDPNAPVADWDYFPKLKREPRRDPLWTQVENLTPKSFPQNKMECDRFMNTIDTSPPPLREASNEACEGYAGVLHIRHYDEGGASGACFFLFTIGMLAWAEQHNYLPWIHIADNTTIPIWDPIVHTNRTRNITFEMMTGMDIGWARDRNDTRWSLFPGKPFQARPPHPETFVLDGTGVWEHYFLPINDFVPGDLSCRDKPIVQMSSDHISPGIHSNAPWTPRAWRYTESDLVGREDLSWDEWFKPQRKHGAEMTERYIRFNSMIERRAHCAFPDAEFSLGMHIRHGDKVEREVIDPDRFFDFAEAFVNNGGGSIYLATDSSTVVDIIFKDWPKHVTDRIIYQTSVLGRSPNTTAAFDVGVSHHRTNIEALTDILALSKSTFFLHGLSAMSEAVFYLNPGLVARSINLEDDTYAKFHPEQFAEKIMPLGKKET